MANDECDHDRVVELSRNWDEVRYEVKREGEVAGKGDQEELAAAWNARLPSEACDEDDAIGNEGRECAGFSATT